MQSTIDDLHKSRDEARNSLQANAAQYMRIMDLANRLQVKGEEDRKKWEREKKVLEERVRGLEGVVLSGGGGGGGGDTNTNTTHQATTGQVVEISDERVRVQQQRQQGGEATVSEQLLVIPLLRAEVARLRERNSVLEEAVRRIRDEGVVVREAARGILESAEKVEGVMGGLV